MCKQLTYAFKTKCRRSFQTVRTPWRDKQDDWIWLELQLKVSAHLGSNLPSTMNRTLLLVRFKIYQIRTNVPKAWLRIHFVAIFLLTWPFLFLRGIVKARLKWMSEIVSFLTSIRLNVLHQWWSPSWQSYPLFGCVLMKSMDFTYKNPNRRLN